MFGRKRIKDLECKIQSLEDLLDCTRQVNKTLTKERDCFKKKMDHYIDLSNDLKLEIQAYEERWSKLNEDIQKCRTMENIAKSNLHELKEILQDALLRYENWLG